MHIFMVVLRQLPCCERFGIAGVVRVAMAHMHAERGFGRLARIQEAGKNPPRPPALLRWGVCN